MPTIGQITFADKELTYAEGRFLTLKAGARIALIAHFDVNKATRPINSNEVAFSVVGLTEDGKVPIGSAWLKKSDKPGENHGMIFLSLSIDDPSFPAPMNISALPSRDDSAGQTFNLLWNRPNARAAA